MRDVFTQAVAQIAKEEKLDFVLVGLAFVSPNKDLTERAIKRMNSFAAQ